jgi:hypothetical protein
MPRSKALRWGAEIAAVSLVFILALSVCSTSAWADTDPPDRVARLSYLSGDVSMQPGGVNDWTAAQLNRPLTTSDRLWTAKDARAELQIGNSTLRLSGETSFTLANLDNRNVQVQVAQGTLNVHVWKLYEDETFEVDTPNFTVNLLRSGDYRIDVDNQGDTSWITVHEGTAEASGSGQAVTIQPRQQAKFSGANNGTYDVHTAPAPDGFDEWAAARDRRQAEAKSAQYVSREVIGYGDLDEYGTWRPYGTYGAVWVPTTVVVGWAPYRFGHWEWIYPWGWTWIDDAPWGFAPFHYGRWVYAPFGWAWVPGPRYYRPYYAPALVAWVGGRNWGVSVSFGGGYGVGWLPLGPREMYVPWYRASRRYWSNVNVHNTYISNTYVTNIYNTCRGDCDGRHFTNFNYQNRDRGMTAMPHDAFVHSRPVSKYAMNLTPDMVRHAPVMAGADARPRRDAVLGGQARPVGERPPQRAFDRSLVMRNTPPKPVRFDQLNSNARAFPGGPVRMSDSGNGRVATGGPERAGTNPTPDRVVPRPPSRVIEMQGERPPVNARNVERPDRSGNAGEPATGSRWAVPRPPERSAQGPNNGNNNQWGGRPDRGVPRPSTDRPGRDLQVNGGVPRPSREVENRVPRPDRNTDGGTPRGERQTAPERAVPRPEGSASASHVRRAPMNEPVAQSRSREMRAREAPHAQAGAGRSTPRAESPARGAEPRSAPHAERGGAQSGGGHRGR